jgi:hypothetical protein
VIAVVLLAITPANALVLDAAAIRAAAISFFDISLAP